jgi:lipoate-protein ligase A
MKYLELTFADPAHNLACDEALLELFESERIDDGLLRVWQPENYFVVLGHSNRLSAEADVAACADVGIPILRRVSGGGTVLQGPGCLNYALILDSVAFDVRNIAAGFHYVLSRHRQLCAKWVAGEVRVEGISDLTVGGRKFSGNAQYRKSRYSLVHGTFLVDFDLSMIERYLLMPAKQPEYRANRPHAEFVTNLNFELNGMRAGLRAAWAATANFEVMPMARVERLVTSRYGRTDWSKKF